MNLLSPFGWLYGRAANLRNALYERGTLSSHSLGVRTISVGNITVGGTGKTPLVTLVVEMLADSGEAVCILTRGYGRANPNERVLVSDGEKVLVDAAAGGDEPVELALKLAGKAVVVADADRVSAAKWALEKFGVTVFVLDDGFQHRPAKRDLDIVCMDATDPFGGNEVLPAGRLREPLENLRRANAIVITRADLSDNIEDLRSEISNLNPSAAVFLAENLLTRVTLLEEFHAKTLSAQSRKVEEALNFNRGTSSLAFCALGNPYNFFSLLDSGGFEVWQTKAFSDHHSYSQKDILELERISRDVCVEQFLTTAKDAVKLNDLRFEIPCYVVEIKTAVSDADQFRTLITAS